MDKIVNFFTTIWMIAVFFAFAIALSCGCSKSTQPNPDAMSIEEWLEAEASADSLEQGEWRKTYDEEGEAF